VPITVEHTKENLCAAHVYALSAMAGVALRGAHVHDYGVDGSFSPVVEREGRRAVSGFPLDFQAKSTVKWEIVDGHVIYDLESKTYNDIVLRTEAETTLILILLCLPRDSEQWHTVAPDCTTLRNCCYWHFFDGEKLDNERSTKRIKIPVPQLLTPTSLLDLMAFERSRRTGQAA